MARNVRSTKNWLKMELAINALRKMGIMDVIMLGDIIDCPGACESSTRLALKAIEGTYRDMSFAYVRGNHDDADSYRFRHPIDWAKYPEYSFSAFPYSGGMEILSSSPDGKMAVFSHTPFFSLGRHAMNDDICNWWNRKDRSKDFLPYDELFRRKGIVISGHYHTPFLMEEPHYEGNRECTQVYVPAVSFMITDDGFVSVNDNDCRYAWIDSEGRITSGQASL